MKILFMGTPDFAAAALEALANAPAHEVVGVFTMPPKPRGRGMETQPSPVGALAERLGIPCYTPASLRGDAFEENAAIVRELAPDVAVVAAYGKILTPEFLALPPRGCVNIHASLLPRWRGAAPMQRAIIAGDRVSGITTMQMDAGIDTGDILQMREVPIGEDDNFETLHDALAAAGAELILETLAGIEDGTVTPRPQPSDGSCYAAKITKADSALDFTCPAADIHNRIRGLSPFPGSVAVIKGEVKSRAVKLMESRLAPASDPAVPGTVVSLDGDVITVACGPNGADRISVTSLTPEGKKRMTSADFIHGRGVSVGDVME